MTIEVNNTENVQLNSNSDYFMHSDTDSNEKVPTRYKVAITTVDNPYDPFDDFDHWYQFDMQAGYNSCAYLDRIAKTSDALSDAENVDEIERAIDEIIKYDFMNVYRKIKRKAN